jgi:polyphenol oxidase
MVCCRSAKARSAISKDRSTGGKVQEHSMEAVIGAGPAETDGSSGTRPSGVFSAMLTSVGVPHAFSTRHGGVSSGIFASLNFGNPGELPPEQRDPPANIRRNWIVLKQSIASAIPDSRPEPREIIEVYQVHGAAVCVVLRGDATPRDADGHDIKADAIVTDDPDRLVSVRVADCTPVLIASSDGRIVAAIHAGWRGVVGGVAVEAVKQMVRLGADPAGIVAAIGPCIGPESFEVGAEVVAEFRRAFGAATPHVRPIGGEKALVDLKGALREQLIGVGVNVGRIDVLPQCTVRDAADFFSHRREKGRTGRMVGIIGPRPGSPA